MAEAQCTSSSPSSSSSSSREDVRFDLDTTDMTDCKATGKTSAGAATCDPAWEKLVQKQRSELMYELRNLQHGEKPVTGKDTREKVETFLQEQINPSSNRRPERRSDDPVVLEVSGLIERRRVTSALGSSDFKRELENTIRGTIVRQEREAERARREQDMVAAAVAARAVANDNWETSSQSSYSSAISSQSSLEQNHMSWPPAPPSMVPPDLSAAMQQPHPMMPQLPPLPAQYPVAHQPPLYHYQGQFMPPAGAHHHTQHAWSPMAMPRPPVNMAHPWQQPPPPPQQVMYHGGPPPQQPQMQRMPQQRLPPWQQMQRSPAPSPYPTQGVYPWQRQRSTPPNMQQPGQVSSIEAFRQAQREQLVSEISELVQRRLVSQTLEGDFRGHLEIRMQERLETSNTDGAQVADFVRSLRPSTHYSRNDFSHLGISAPRPTDASLLSQGVTNAAFESMRHELEELKNMVRMNFEMQLDIQRAIRQEVAAALATVRGGSSEPQSSTPNATSQPIQDGHCLICLDRGVDCVLYQCGHMCVCMTCGLRLKGQGLHCPMCRAPIRDVIRAYRCVEESSEN